MLKFLAADKPHRVPNKIIAIVICVFAGPVYAAADNKPEIKTLRELAIATVLEHNLLWYEELPPVHQKVVAATVVAREKEAEDALEQIDVRPFSLCYTTQQLRNNGRLAQVHNLRCMRAEVGTIESELVNEAPALMSLALYSCAACVINLCDFLPEDDTPFYMLTGLCVGACTFVSDRYTGYCVRLFANRLSSDRRWRTNLERARALAQNDAPQPMRMSLQVREKTD